MADAYYFKVVEHGSLTTSLHVGGLVGPATIQYTMAEDAPALPTGIDLVELVSEGSAIFGASSGVVRVFYNRGRAILRGLIAADSSVNGVSPTSSTTSMLFFTAAADEVCIIASARSFPTVTMGGYSHSSSEVLYYWKNFAFKDLVITDDNGVHTFTFDSSVLSGNITSDTGTLTLGIHNPAADNSHWILYDDGTGGGDTEVPVITVTPSTDSTINVGDDEPTYTATVTDNVDQNLTVIKTGSVGAGAGTYTLLWNVTDSAGNVAVEVVRTVTREAVAVEPQLLALNSATQVNQAQPLTLAQIQQLAQIQAQQSTTATLLSLVQSLALESVSSQQVNTASLLSLAQTLLLDTINASQITQAETLTLSQRGSQALDLILASQTTNTELLSLAQSLKLSSVNATQVSTTNVISLAQILLIESIQAQQITTTETLTIGQTSGQSLSLVSAEQVTQASLLSVVQQSKLALIVAQQVAQSQLIDINTAQAISMVFAQQITTAETLDLTQQNVLIDGQVITLISATQNTTTSTLLISKIALADLINAEQITTTTALSIAENSKLVTIDAEQVTLATLLNLSQTADGTSLKGLTLTDITSVYSLNEINKTTYTLKEL